MRPIKLTMSAFGPYAAETVIEMDKLGACGLYLITGDTGAGKTTIFDAITYALFGEASGMVRETGMFRSKYADPAAPTFVELVFCYHESFTRCAAIRNICARRKKVMELSSKKRRPSSIIQTGES